MEKYKVKVFIIFSILIFMTFCRDHRYLYVKQSLINGDVIEITFDKNEKHVWGYIPHIHTSGGGDIKYDISFEYKNSKYNFSTDSSLILINFWKENFFIVIKDYVGDDDSYKIVYRYFKSVKNRFKEINSDIFPKFIAIPNLYYFKMYPKIDQPDIVDPTLEDFRKTIVGVLWLKLEKGIPYKIPWKKEYRKTLIDYKKKYIDPHWNKEALKKNYPEIIRKDN